MTRGRFLLVEGALQNQDGGFNIQWSTDEEAIAYDNKSDGMYPLMTNDRRLSLAEVLQAHKGQPMIEKRFEQVKTVHEIAPISDILMSPRDCRGFQAGSG
ncbi:MAG: hypothetical protein ACP5E2_15910, partial [Terracidiphilus sp.]